MATAREPDIVAQTIDWFDPWIHNTLINVITELIPGFRPEGRLRDLVRVIEEVRRRSSRTAGIPLLFEASELPVVKYMLLRRRLDIARDTEARKHATHDGHTRKQLDRVLEGFDKILGYEPFVSSPVADIPRLSDYLTVQAIQARKPGALNARTFDEKFGILCAPALFLSDLITLRGFCFERRCPLIVGYLDIDNLKMINTQLTETIVDESILPRFMAELEAWIYQHGFVYRMGGDEYAVVVPNMDERLGLSFFSDLQRRLRNLDYALGESIRITVSIGLCVIKDECFLTEKEIQLTANRAKNFAKEQGKDRVAGANIRRDAFHAPREFRVMEERCGEATSKAVVDGGPATGSQPRTDGSRDG